MSKTGQKPPSDQLEELGRRLDKAVSERRGQAGPDTAEGSAASLALRAISELVVGLVVCMSLGWMADRWLGTYPWIMLAMMPLGLAAGVLNVVRLANSKRTQESMFGDGPPAPSVKDDDGD